MIVETVGPDGRGHPETDWQERDNFATLEQARGYARFKHRQYPMTPYRIVETTMAIRLAGYPEDAAEHRERGVDLDAPLYCVEFVPWVES